MKLVEFSKRYRPLPEDYQIFKEDKNYLVFWQGVEVYRTNDLFEAKRFCTRHAEKSW